MKKLTKKIALIALFCTSLTLTSCDTSWLPGVIESLGQIASPFISKLTSRGEAAPTLTKIKSPTFSASRGAESNFLSEVKTIQHISYNITDADFRTQINKKMDESLTVNGLTKIYTADGNSVIGKVDGENVKDVFVIKDDGKTFTSFGLEGTFPKSQIDASSKSGDIFNTLNYLNK